DGANDQAFLEQVLSTFEVQKVVFSLALDAATQLFEVGGSSASSTRFELDRHWRNIRTLASHNPLVLRQQAIGDYLLNGTEPSWRRVPPSADLRAEDATGSEERAAA